MLKRNGIAPPHPWTKFQLNQTNFAMGLSTRSVSQSKTTILIASLDKVKKCNFCIFELGIGCKDGKGRKDDS